MNNFYNRISNKIVNSPYISRWSVLTIDSLVATFATLSVYLILGFFVKSSAPFSCYLIVAALALGISMGTFLLFGTHRGIMRHTTMQEIMRISLAVVFKGTVLLLIFLIFIILFIIVQKILFSENFRARFYFQYVFHLSLIHI